MHRLAAAAAALAITAAACGGGGGAEKQAGDVHVGEGLSLGEGESTATTTVPAGATGPEGGVSSDGVTPAAERPSSPHPTTASGQVIVNTTVREIDGFHVQLTVDEAIGYEGDLIFDLIVTNERDTSVWYEPGPAEGALVRNKAGEVVWRNGACGGVTSSFGHVELAPGENTRLTFQYDRDGGGDESCALGPGRYDVIGQFFWCPPDQVQRDACSSLSSVASHPVSLKLEDG